MTQSIINIDDFIKPDESIAQTFVRLGRHLDIDPERLFDEARKEMDLPTNRFMELDRWGEAGWYGCPLEFQTLLAFKGATQAVLDRLA